ncbi:MAG: Uma2 family endonuclease [Prochlorothrix sp.]|nr:Uma2 family endonuclease [Prochlorothrix sp.]
MPIALTPLTLDQFLALTCAKADRVDPGQPESLSNAFQELENGEIIEMPAESELNRRIAMFLVAELLKAGFSFQQLTLKTEVAVSGARATVRVPDVLVLSEELAAVLAGASRSIVLMDMPPPLLAVEVVSPGQEVRDYRYKRSEYGARGIAEYWIVDPQADRVTVLTRVEGLYEEAQFTGTATIVSAVCPGLTLTANQILSPG